MLLDKPSGITSNAALQRVKRLYHAKKAGHTGSLDPLATGLLPICFGQATKACEYLLAADKQYVTHLKLGQTTDTYDAEGEVVSERAIEFTDAQLDAALATFKGSIEQVPPMYSALKQGGVPLYELARKGQMVERAARSMTVYEVSAERIGKDELRVHLHTSGGFYVRSFAYDLGEALGCGAHVAQLRRIAKQSLRVKDAISLEQLESSSPEAREALMLPVDILLTHLPSQALSAVACQALLNGQPVQLNDVSPAALTRLVRDDGDLFGIGCVEASGIVKTHKIFVKSAL